MTKEFPYTVKKELMQLNNGKCCYTVCDDNRCFHRHQCRNKIKEYIDEIGFCKMHGNTIREFRK